MRQVLDNTTAVVFIKDANGRYSYANGRFCEMVGRAQSELIGGYDSDVFPPEVVARLRADDRRVLELGAPQEIEEHLIVDGRPCTYLATKFPLIDEQGNAYAICGIATDITRRKRGEEALRGAALAVSTAEGAALYQELTRYLATTLGVECCFIAECTSSATTHVRTLAVYTERGYEENIEYALPGHRLRHGGRSGFPPGSRGCAQPVPRTTRMFKRLAIESYAAYPLNDSHGRALGLIAVMSQRPLADRELVESMLKIFATRAAAEIERSRAEDARRVSEASYRAIFEAAEDAIFVHDWDSGAIVDANPKACEHYGYDCEEIKGIRIGDISSGVYPYVEEEALRLINEAKQGKPLRFEWHRRSRDGSLHWDEVCLKSAVIAGEKRVLAFTREITERKLAEDALRRGALAVSAAGGEAVFEELVQALATILDVDVAFVALAVAGTAVAAAHAGVLLGRAHGRGFRIPDRRHAVRDGDGSAVPHLPVARWSGIFLRTASSRPWGWTATPACRSTMPRATRWGSSRCSRASRSPTRACSSRCSRSSRRGWSPRSSACARARICATARSSTARSSTPRSTA